jgi:hypothetical protein
MAPKSVYSKMANFCAFYVGNFLINLFQKTKKNFETVYGTVA